jgi:hypothetical protein
MGFENRVLRKIFGCKRGREQEAGGNGKMRSFVILHYLFLYTRWFKYDRD